MGVCERHFKEEELVLKCRSCQRWLHANHEQVYDEQEMLQLVQQQYQCQECRPSDTTYRTNSNQGQEVVIIEQPNQITTQNRGQPEPRDELIKTHEKDGVIFTEAGIGQFNRELLRVIGSKRRQASSQSTPKTKQDIEQQS